jgi:small subunit ribosomal protein S20
LISGANWRAPAFFAKYGEKLHAASAGTITHGSTRARMANTTSAKKASRKIARRTAINQMRRSRLRTYLGKVEDAIASGDRAKALAALNEAEPIIMRAAQRGIVHRNTASRKVSRLTHRLAQLGK